MRVELALKGFRTTIYKNGKEEHFLMGAPLPLYFILFFQYFVSSET